MVDEARAERFRQRCPTTVNGRETSAQGRQPEAKCEALQQGKRLDSSSRLVSLWPDRPGPPDLERRSW